MQKLTSNFEIEEYGITEKDITDYEIFRDKELLDELRNKIIGSLIEENIKTLDNIDNFINNEIDKISISYDLTPFQKDYIYNLIKNEINGFGPITRLLQDNSITEIMVNGPNKIYIERDGKVIPYEDVSFINDKHIIRTIGRIVEPLGKTIDASNPMVDARLVDGSRLNAIIPPLSLTGPILTIRKFSHELENMEELLLKGALTNSMAEFLEACVKAKLNIIISGGTGTGKTTLLNILSNFIGSDERIITIEDAAELKLNGNHVISLETRNSNYEGEGEVTIRDLVRNSLRMRPDRIIVGEVRGIEAFDMMQAMNTGHEGSITTMHANSPGDAINRLETMMLMGDVSIPVNAIRGYIENAIDIVIQIDRMTDGKRKITNISEVVNMKDGNVVLNEIFSFKQTGVTSKDEVIGEFELSKKLPKIYNKIVRKGINIEDIFAR